MELLIVPLFIWIGVLYYRQSKIKAALTDQIAMYVILYKAAIMSGDCRKLIDYLAYYNDQLSENVGDSVIRSLYIKNGLEPDTHNSISPLLRKLLVQHSINDYHDLKRQTPSYDHLFDGDDLS